MANEPSSAGGGMRGGKRVGVSGGMGDGPDADARALWQALPPEGGAVSMDDVRRRARAFERRLRRRKLVLLGSGAGNVGLLAVLIWLMPDLRWALAWLTGTACWLMYQFHVRTAAGARALDTTGLAFYRDALVRERDLARGGWWWFLAPIAVNQAVLTLGYMTSRYYHGTTVEIAAWASMGASTLTVLAIVAQRLRREAAEYQRSLDSLDAVGVV